MNDTSFATCSLHSFLRTALVLVFAITLSFLAALPLVAGPWEPLFNGKDLTGWKQINGTAPYAVVDGAIVGTTIAESPNSFLATEKTYGDFIFECDVMQDVGPTNSGVQFRGLSKADYMEGHVYGYHLDIDPSARAWTGGIYDEARRGWFYPVDLNPRAQSAYQYGRWNHLRIEAIGTTLRTWVNGIAVAYVIDAQTPVGFFALQIHSVKEGETAGRRVWWRDLRVQTTDLHPSPADDLFIRNTTPNVVSDAERAQGWRLLWDGSTAKGWRGAHGAAFPATRWSIEGGVLSVLAGTGAAAGGDILSEEQFSAFELAWEFQVVEGANSGVKYFVVENPTAPEGERVLGFEYQLLDDEHHPDAKLGAAGNRMLGSLYDLIPRSKVLVGLGVAPRLNEWQHARIVATRSGHVEHWFNGIKVVEYERGSPLFKALIARSKYEKFAGFGLAEKGPILLQDHGNLMRFRSIKVRTL